MNRVHQFLNYYLPTEKQTLNNCYYKKMLNIEAETRSLMFFLCSVISSSLFLLGNMVLCLSPEELMILKDQSG